MQNKQVHILLPQLTQVGEGNNNDKKWRRGFDLTRLSTMH